jgi:hypothetical protein
VINKTSIGGTGNFSFLIDPLANTIGFVNIETNSAGVTASSVINNVLPGIYEVTEIIGSGWTGITGASVNISSGCTGTADFINTFVPTGTLVIAKTSNGGTGNFEFNIIPPAAGTGTVNIITPNDGVAGILTLYGVEPNEYNIVEVGQTGWTGTISFGVNVTANGTGTAQFTNTVTTAQFTDDVTTGTLVITKTVDQSEGTFEFTFDPSIPGISSVSITTSGTGDYTIYDVPTGKYTITETFQKQWTSVENPIDVTVTGGDTTYVAFENIANKSP